MAKFVEGCWYLKVVSLLALRVDSVSCGEGICEALSSVIGTRVGLLSRFTLTVSEGRAVIGTIEELLPELFSGLGVVVG